MIERNIESTDPSRSLQLADHPLLSHVSSEKHPRVGETSKAMSVTSTFKPLPTGVKPTIDTMMPTLQQDILSIFRGFRNGFVYGIKIRFPHALIMTFLFVEGSLKTKWNVIYSRTKEHAVHLGQYVALYKLCCAIIRRIFGTPNYWLIHFLSGAISGAMIWTKKTAVNHQINLYVYSRVCDSITRSVIERGYWKCNNVLAYQAFVVLLWAIGMYYFECEAYNLPQSTRESAYYTYHNEKDLPDWSIPSLLNFFT